MLFFYSFQILKQGSTYLKESLTLREKEKSKKKIFLRLFL